MAVKYRRKLDADWVFDDLCVLDANGERQTIFGVDDMAATLQTLTGTVLIDSSQTGVSIDEVDGDPTTYGNFSYVVDKAVIAGLSPAVAVGNTYQLDFRATINGNELPIPEEDYIVIEVI